MKSDFFAALFFPQNCKFGIFLNFDFSRLMSRKSDISLHTQDDVGFRKKRRFMGRLRMNSGVLRVARGGSGANAPPLAARP